MAGGGCEVTLVSGRVEFFSVQLINSGTADPGESIERLNRTGYGAVKSWSGHCTHASVLHFSMPLFSCTVLLYCATVLSFCTLLL